MAWDKNIKDSLLTAFVALILCIPFITFRTEIFESHLIVKSRYILTAIVIAAVFFGRLALNLTNSGIHHIPILLISAIFFFVTAFNLIPAVDIKEYGALQYVLLIGSAVIVLRTLWNIKQGRTTETTAPGFSEKFQDFGKFIGPFLILGALIFPFTDLADRRNIDLAILLMTYIMLGWGLNIIVGLAGLLDLGYVAFYAVGAYSYALLAQNFGLGFWTCLPLAGLFACMAGALLGFPVLRLRGDYFAIVTLGFGEIIRVVLINWHQFTGGSDGISGIPRPTFFGLPFKRSVPEGDTFHSYFDLTYSSTDKLIFMYFLILLLALIVNFFTMRVRKLPVGRAWEALREDDIAARSLGINLRNTKLAAFMMSATFGGFAGSFFATKQGFISPESFSFIESALILAIVVLGGVGSQLGVVIAAIFLIGLPEFIRELEQYRMLVFGAGMVTIMVLKPKGLLSKREPTLKLFSKLTASKKGV